MASLSMVVPHRFSQEEALDRFKKFSGNLKSQFAGQINDIRERWSGSLGNFSFSAKGYRLTGTVVVEPSNVKINLRLPFIATPYKDRIERMIRQEVEKILNIDSGITSHPICSFLVEFALSCLIAGLIVELFSKIDLFKNHSKITREKTKQAVKVLYKKELGTEF